MLILPRILMTVIGAFAPMFSTRVFAPVKRLLVGAMLAPGTRTITAVLRVMGPSADWHCANSHRVRSRARWPALRGGRRLLRALVRACAPTAPVVLGSDDTMERRRGEKMAAKGIDRDPVRASPAHVVNASGWRWVSLMLLAPIRWTTRVWGRPWLPVLSPSARYDPHRGRSPRPWLDRARPAVRLVRHGWPERDLVVVGDSADAALEWLEAVRHAVCVITRWRRAAALYEPAPPRHPRPNGRPRTKGKRLPPREQVLTDSTTPWTTVTGANGYGARDRHVQSTSEAAVW